MTTRRCFGCLFATPYNVKPFRHLSLRAKALRFPMSQAAGYVLNVGASRRADLEGAIEGEEPVAEAVPEFRHSRNAPLVCFVGFEPGAITHLAKGRRGLRAGTGLRRLNLENVVALDVPVAHTDVVGAVPNRLRTSVAARLSVGGFLPPASFAAVVDAVRSLSPESRPVLDRYSHQRRATIGRLSSEARSALAYQKESVATAISLAGLNRDVLQSWQTDNAVPASFLDGLPSARLREDAMVVADMSQVPGLDRVRELPFGAAIFEDNSVRLTVIIANHLPLEQQFGVDLVYFNNTYHSFVMVQYKAMESDTDGKPFLRLPNTQLTAELARMDAVEEALHDVPRNDVRTGYRLLEAPFFLKLCSRIVFNPDDVALVPGMYLSRDYWRLIEADATMTGPRGGRRVDFRNVGRYLDNSEFIALVKKAWIGTTPAQSDLLSGVVREILASGRTLTLAIKTEAATAEVAPAVDSTAAGI